MARIPERQRQTPDIWPGFVDALAALLVVIIFLVMIFTVAQFFLSDVLVGRERALDDLKREVATVSELLSLERTKASRAREDLEQRIADLGQEIAERDETIARLIASSKELFALLSIEKERYREAAADVKATKQALEQTRSELKEEQDVSAEARRQIEILNILLAGIRGDLARRTETVSQLTAKSEELTAALTAERERSGTAEKALDATARLLEQARTELAAEKKANAEARKEIKTLTARVAALQQDLADHAETIARSRARTRQLQALLAAERERSATAENKLEVSARMIAQARDEIGTLRTELTAERERAARAEEELEARARTIAQTRGELDKEREAGAEARREIEALTALATTLRQDLANREELAARSGARSRELEKLLTAERERSARAEEELEARARTIARLRGELAKAREAGAEAREEIEVSTAQAETLRQEIAEHRQVISLLGIRSQELSDLLAAEEKRADRAEKEAESKGRALERKRVRLAEEQEIGAAARKRAEAVAEQVTALRRELAKVNTALEVSETREDARLAEIVDLEERLSRALMSRVAELARYRSEFFGKLREVLGDQEGIRIVGDRFVVQSEILFDSGSTDFSENALVQIDRLARTLTDVSARIPDGVDWVLRIDGHTDRIPINTPAYPSNWELSTGRAIAVVRQLIDRGIPADRLFAAGFGSNHPIDTRDTVDAYRLNRRIELKLTQR